MTLGVDLSDFQLLTDAWALKASGRTFAIRKVADGLTGPGAHTGADRAPSDIAALRAAGVDVAGYAFVYPDLDGGQQAANAVGIARSLGLASLACDCEVTDGLDWNAVAATMHAFLTAVRGAGLGLLLYDNRTWVDALGAETWGVPIWYANPSVVTPDRGCVCWQCGEGTVPGVAGTCDLDIWTAPAAYPTIFPTPTEVPTMLPSNCTDQGMVLVFIRSVWDQYRTDPMTEADQNVCAFFYHLPADQTAWGVHGFGGSPDLLMASIIDDAKTKGCLRPGFENAV